MSINTSLTRSGASALKQLSSSQMEKGIPEPLMHKNHLQEYTQKLDLCFPVYHTINEGFQHAPRFRSTVLVDGQSYASEQTFPHRKEAEQDAARLALESIKEKMKHEARLNIHKYTKYCKSILYEFAVKMNLKAPAYRINTMLLEQSRPIYVCSMFFDGKAYNGEVGRSRKEAEQLAAWTAIRKLQESDSGILRGIIHAKVKLFNPLHKVKSTSFKPSNKLVVQQSVESSQSQQLINVMPSAADNCSKQPVTSSRENKFKLEGNSTKKKGCQDCRT